MTSMPGFIPHFIAGNAMFLLGGIYIQRYTDIPMTTKNNLILYGVCIGSSIIPDFPLGLYHILSFGTFETLVVYHSQLHLIISPIASITFIILAWLNLIKKKQIWIMGVFCIFLHIIMDANLHEIGVLI